MRDNPPVVGIPRSAALVVNAVVAGLTFALVLAVLGAAGLVVFVPAAVGLAVLIAALRSSDFRRSATAAVLAAAVTAVVLYVVLLALAISAIPEDFHEVM